jgi:Fic family protein
LGKAFLLHNLSTIVLRKRDTTSGFQPDVAATDDILRPALGAIRLDGRLDGLVLSPQIHQLTLNLARLRSVVSSLRQENVKVDFEEARAVMDTGRASGTKQQLVLRLAREYADIHEMPRSRLPFTVKEILAMHGRVFAGFDEEDYAPGRTKTDQNGVGHNGMVWSFEATPPERTMAELEVLVTWLNDHRARWPPAVVAALFFAEFQAIHPFNNGNGRIGRLLNVRVLKLLGHENATLVALDGRFFRSGEKYYNMLASTNDGTLYHPWVRYYAKMLQASYDDAVKIADLRPILEQQNLQASRDVLAWVFGRGPDWFGRRDFPNTQGHSDSALTLALTELAQQGILEHNNIERRGRKYRVATGFLEKAFAGLSLETSD